MFTGLIEETGIITGINTSSSGCVLTISCKKILGDVKIGDSICVDGVCQSVVSIGSNCFTTELSQETLKVTTFSSVKSGKKVNLERALTLNQRLDGHLVSGHIDCIAKYISVSDEGFSKKLSFEIQGPFEKYMVYKGSVAINGISLTISDIKDKIFSVTIIPITIQETNLSELKIGDLVNIETDIIGKYVEKILLLNNNDTSKDGKIDENLLKENGFI